KRETLGNEYERFGQGLATASVLTSDELSQVLVLVADRTTEEGCVGPVCALAVRPPRRAGAAPWWHWDRTTPVPQARSTTSTTSTRRTTRSHATSRRPRRRVRLTRCCHLAGTKLVATRS